MFLKHGLDQNLSVLGISKLVVFNIKMVKERFTPVNKNESKDV